MILWGRPHVAAHKMGNHTGSPLRFFAILKGILFCKSLDCFFARGKKRSFGG
jgi:hypothetical protein